MRGEGEGGRVEECGSSFPHDNNSKLYLPK